MRREIIFVYLFRFAMYYEDYDMITENRWCVTFKQISNLMLHGAIQAKL